ncbi:endolytic transglycosylase MltG, partial [bacterium]
MSKIKIFLISTAIIFCGFGVIGFGVFLRVRGAIYNDFGIPNTVKEFVITSGENVKNISEQLENEKIISSAFAFQIYVWMKNAGTKIQAGEYEISLGENIPYVVSLLVEGKVRDNSVQITIPEGFNSQQIAERIKSASGLITLQGEITNYDISNIVNTPDVALRNEYWFLEKDRDKNPKSLEGYLFPDTYKFDEDANADDVIGKMLDNFEKKIEPLKSQILESDMTLHEIVTLASIVEKEVVSQEDMKIVAGLFLHRLRIKMLLQSDATINFVTQKGNPSPLYKDLEVDSPYNTYKYGGLPPGPICNP